MRNTKINLDSDSETGSDSDGEFFTSSVAGDRHGPNDKGILDDCEFLRQRNQDLDQEIGRMRGLVEERAREFADNTRQLDLAWTKLPPRPFSFLYFATYRGFEHLELYMWIIRDMGWAFGYKWRTVSEVVGGFAILHAILILIRNAYSRDPFETSHSFSKLLWVAAVYRMLMATINDPSNYFIEPLYVSNMINRGRVSKDYLANLTLVRGQTESCLVAAFALLVVTIILKYRANKQLYPFKEGNFSLFGRPYSVPQSPYEESTYVSSSGINIVGTWRDLENILLWFLVARDMSFLGYNSLAWAAFCFLAMITCLFMSNSSLNSKLGLVEHCHYLAGLVWVGGVVVFQMGHLIFQRTYDAWDFAGPKYIRAEFTCNEWAGIILVCAFVPIVLLYLIWILATVTGAIKAPAHYPDADACLKPLSRARPGALQHANSSLPPTHTQSVPLENEWLEANKPSRFAPV